MDAEARSTKAKIAPIFRWAGVWGPGLLVMLADTDAGNVVTAAQSGARWGYRLLPPAGSDPRSLHGPGAGGAAWHLYRRRVQRTRSPPLWTCLGVGLSGGACGGGSRLDDHGIRR